MVKFGDLIKKLRGERGFSQDEVALAIGISAPALSKLENNKTEPMQTTKIALARFYGTNFGDNDLDKYLGGNTISQSKKEIIEETSIEEIFSIKFGGGAARRSKEDLIKLRRLVERETEKQLNGN